MLLLHEIKWHILRVPGRSAVAALVAALLVCGMALYTRNIHVTQSTLDELAQQMPVQVKVTSRDGSSSVNLRIESEDFDAFTAQDVRDVLCTSAFSFRLDSVDNRPVSGFMRVHAANTIAALDGPAPEGFTYLDGWDESFLQADEPVCAVDANFARDNGIALGSRLQADLFSLRREAKNRIQSDKVQAGEFTVVALYQDGSTGEATSGWNATVPIGWLRRQTEASVDKKGEPVPFFYDSASAYLANPRELNAFKDAMFAHGFRQSSPMPDRQDLGDALSIDDEMYIKTSCEMVESLELYRFFLLPFFGLMVLTIALVTFLTLRSSRRHIAIASSLGRQKLLNAASPFLGTVIVQAAGCLTALPLLCFTIGLLPGTAGMITGVFMLCAMAGTALALVFLFRFDTLTLLTKTD